MGRKSLKFQQGLLYEISFKDHSVGPAGLLICSVVGYCIMDDIECVQLSSWIVHTSDQELYNDNLEKTTIVKSTITGVRKICKTKMK